MKKQKIDIRNITKYLEPDNNNKQMINKLINDDEISRKEFEAYLDVWEKSANVKDFDNINAQNDWEKVRSRMNLKTHHKTIPLQSYLLRIAAILLLAIGLVVFFNQIFKIKMHPGKSVNYFETAALSEIKNVELPDGTVISLNKNSKIIQNDNYGKTNRDIILEGEAFFEVAKNPNLPFKVHTLNSTVEVLGTSFNIKCDSQKVTVGVVTGKVAFYQTGNSANKVTLIPDNTGIYKGGENSFITRNSMDPNTIAWHTGRLVFKNTPYNEVFAIIAHYFNKELIYKADKPIVNGFTTNFENLSLNEMVESINYTLRTNKFAVTTTENSIIVTQP
jgi:transmembrane sensor